MKTLILVGDGMGDLPIPELAGQTILEAAKTPNIDALALKSKLALLRTVPVGMQPGSDVANLSLLGYRPEQFYTGRSPLEAASLNVKLKKNDIAFRLNFVNISVHNQQTTMVDYSAGHISTPEATELIAALQKAIPPHGLTLHPGISYRHLLVVDQQHSKVLTVPPHDYPNKVVTEFVNNYQDTPLIANFRKDAEAILANHSVNLKRLKNGLLPANSIWLWGQGEAPKMASMQEQFQITGGLISAVDLLKGIGVYAGMEIYEVKGATGYLDTNYQGKVYAAITALAKHDLVFVHIEAPDETGHQGLIAEKIQAVEDFDLKIVKPMVEAMKEYEAYKIVICMDHYTPVSLKTHIADPVPICLFDSNKTRRGALYSEKNGIDSGLLYQNGFEFMSDLLQK